MNFNQKSIPSCTPANLAAPLAGGPICLANVTPVQAALDPTTRGDNTNFGEDLQRGYKQTAGFASLDYDLIPKVLTVTGGTRWYRYVEQEVGSQYGSSVTPTCALVNQPNGSCIAKPINYDDHHATFTGFKSRGNLTWHLTPDPMIYNPPVYGNTTFGVTGPTYRIKGGELQFAARATEGLTLNASLSYNDSKQTTSPCIHSAGVTPTTPSNPTPAGACITQVRSGKINVAVMNPLGAIGSTPAFSPKFQANARARYEWSAVDYRWLVMAGIN